MPKLQVNFSVNDSDYAYVNELVQRFMMTALPGTVINEREMLVDRLTKLFVGTRRIRLAGCPSPESLVLMREVIREAVSTDNPIPVLIASGPKKPKSGQVDVAELSAVRTLVDLQRQTVQHYAPGFNFRIRLEDSTGHYLEGDEELNHLHKYCDDFVVLCRMMDEFGCLDPLRESQHGGTEMIHKAHYLQPLFLKVYRGEGSTIVEREGWKGSLENWWNFLDRRYAKLYPEWNRERRTIQSTKYLATLLARHKLGLRGDDEDWSIGGKHLEISFAPPTPNTSRVSTRVYYRTMSTKQTKMHVPYWRSKGFFRLDDAELRMGLLHSSCAKKSDFEEAWLTLTDIGSTTSRELRVAADFRVC